VISFDIEFLGEFQHILRTVLNAKSTPLASILVDVNFTPFGF
jgi:hypothetical protein